MTDLTLLRCCSVQSEVPSSSLICSNNFFISSGESGVLSTSGFDGATSMGSPDGPTSLVHIDVAPRSLLLEFLFEDGKSSEDTSTFMFFIGLTLVWGGAVS